MNVYFFVAALLIYALAFAHSILGEWLILVTLFKMDLPVLYLMVRLPEICVL